jgi:hypothetical protein
VESQLGAFADRWHSGIAWHLFALLDRPGSEITVSAVSEFWEEAVGENGGALIDEADFAAGFIDGALKVWEAVQDKI